MGRGVLPATCCVGSLPIPSQRNIELKVPGVLRERDPALDLVSLLARKQELSIRTAFYRVLFAY